MSAQTTLAAALRVYGAAEPERAAAALLATLAAEPVWQRTAHDWMALDMLRYRPAQAAAALASADGARALSLMARWASAGATEREIVNALPATPLARGGVGEATIMNTIQRILARIATSLVIALRADSDAQRAQALADADRYYAAVRRFVNR